MKQHRARISAAFAAVLVAGLVVLPGLPQAARAASQVVAIGVDHSSPTAHNFEYVDFFPRVGVSVHSGDVIDLGWAATPDGLHTATLLKSGETAGQAWASHILASADSDDGSQLQLNPSIGAPTHPPAGSGAPGACGSESVPCVYDGTTDLNSGVSPTNGTTHFFVRINAPVGTTVTVVCLIHPGMAATFQVVNNATPVTTAAQVAAAAAAQATSDTAEAFAAESAAGPAQVSTNADGTHTVTVVAGTASSHVEVAEMLPQTATVTAGDTVRWVTKTIKDIHTVTFPVGNQPATEPIPNSCEGHPDTLLTGPPGNPPCGNPALFETHLNPAPVGVNVIDNPTTVASSGLMATPPAPFPTRYSFTFPNAGTFSYQCRIHDHMVGTLIVQSRAAAPITTTPHFTG